MSLRYCPACGLPLETYPLAGRERQACPDLACGWVHWDNPLPVVAALIQCRDRDGAVLLARNHAWEPGKFGLVTGFLERDETPEAAVAREVLEETGLVAEAVALIGVYPFARKNEVILAYHVEVQGEIQLNEELAEIRLIPPDCLQAWDYGTGLAVAAWLRSRQGR
ncbi:MAG: NUDIX domain-containing protein [Zoogloeaceae bacterium]|nr:NUDIX domain-containing protein [Zoogloeaceae bacterium]